MSAPSPDQKTCTKCGEIKPLDAFGKRADRPGGTGRRAQCKECVREPARERAAKWHAEHRDEANRKRRERAATPQEQKAARTRQRRRAQTPEYQAYQRAYREDRRAQLRVYHREWSERHPEKAREYAANESPDAKAHRTEYVRQRKAEQRAQLDAFKRERGCTDCGTSEGRLEFDHRPGEEKRFNVSQGLGCSWETLWEEIRRCDVRCSACHRRRHLALREIPLWRTSHPAT